ncbi:Uncharacterized protein LHYA1_G004642 [Lachnellula hyalina]|uniref:PQ loop repeat protein n=1 Tax=Lachnellula hyalina TaxID=1316788 RepID=A0A8H8TYR4_9HELO|nr:Uncharacterized protein LHYA1_G004642 [Lachnellula hyalina]TVY25660.1 Uncharacterized protein LHYA1_G004642 [Lachnellula hyalina]
MNIPIAANVLGTLGAVCWSIQVPSPPSPLPTQGAFPSRLTTYLTTPQLIPQIIINYRRHNTEGLQRSMMLLWALAGIPLGAYNIAENFNVALKIQPQILTVLSLITWIQCFYYSSKWSVSKCILVVCAMGITLGGVEAGLFFALSDAEHRGRHWAVTLMGVLSTVLLSAGVLRHYWDIWVHRTVRGISFIFVGIDAAGDVFSLVSVFFQPKLDILGMVIYATEFVLWCGVFACGGYFNLLPWVKMKVREREQKRERNGDSEEQVQVEEEGASQGVELNGNGIGSSTSVFRTPSSVASERSRVSVRLAQ